MKVKLDENIGKRGQERLRQAGHEAATIAEENLCGAADATLIDMCRRENRCFVTLDRDFGNPLLFKPSQFSGIALLRLPRRPSHQDLLDAVETLVRALSENEILGKLWVVQRGHIREYRGHDEPFDL